VEGQGQPVQPVQLRLALLAAQPDFRRAVQVDGHVGRQTAGGEDRDLAQRGQVKSPAVALVGQRGIVEAVAQNGLAGRQRRADHLPDVLGAGRAEEQRLRLRRHDRALRPVEQDVAHLLADARAARLAGGQDGHAGRLHGGEDTLKLGGLAGAFRPFKGDEHASVPSQAQPHPRPSGVR